MEELAQLIILAAGTLVKMAAEGRAKTTAEEAAALHAAVSAADATDARWDALPGGDRGDRPANG